MKNGISYSSGESGGGDGDSASNAESVNYDNSNSGLEATDVQAAINELNSNL